MSQLIATVQIPPMTPRSVVTDVEDVVMDVDDVQPGQIWAYRRGTWWYIAVKDAHSRAARKGQRILLEADRDHPEWRGYHVFIEVYFHLNPDLLTALEEVENAAA